ncbi:MAG: lytic transglycosylase domain-containing protein [Rickettsiales bacterium]
MTQEEAEHTRSAFMFAERRQWSDAFVHAENSGDEVLQALVKWQYLLDPDSGASFSEINQFVSKYPDWPEQKKLRIRAEQSLADGDVSAEEIAQWFENTPPITGVGKIALVGALQKTDRQTHEKIIGLVHSAWRDGDFTEDQEKSLLTNYGNMLKPEDDVKRTDRLLWEGKLAPAERMMTRVNENRRKLYKTRIALQTGKKDAQTQLAKLPDSLKKDIGLLYDQMVFRAKRGDDPGVISILLITPKKIPYPEKWWKIREAKIRDVINNGNIALAYRLIENHGQEEGTTAADAHWLKGRILLEYKKQPKEAYLIFKKMFSEVKYPVSKSRAAYWAAKAAKQSGYIEEEKEWLNKASAYPTTFYGQLATLIESGTAPLNIPAPPSVDSSEALEFNSKTIVRAVKLCINFNQLGLAGKIINNLVTDAANEREALLASELGVDAGRTYLSVRGAKKALQNNVVLIEAGYPVPKTPDNLELPRPLTLAITRQESEFDSMARSPAGAVGMMQLLPSTAKEVAKKSDMEYFPNKLHDPEYNMILGSLYLQRMIDNYDGSLIMAIAAYNAGPGNVYKWVKKSGKPQRTIDGAVNWIENIPFSETRNYVQRVLENLQIYRHMEAEKSIDADANMLLLGQDLLR